MKKEKLDRQDIISEIRKSYVKNECTHTGKKFMGECGHCKFIYRGVSEYGVMDDYSLVDFKNVNTKIKIRCIVHDRIFEQTPRQYLKHRGCPICNGKIINTADAIYYAKLRRGDLFNYDFLKYVSSLVKVTIICNRCNHKFDQLIWNHLYGADCPECAKITRANNIRLSESEVISRSNEIHGLGRYGYENMIYEGAHIEIEIKCNVCNKSFDQKPYIHMEGHGCPHCKADNTRIRQTKSAEQLLIDFRKIHGNKFNYDFDGYVNSYAKINITCNICHKTFPQRPNDHLSGEGCPYCIGRYRTTGECIAEFKKIHRDRFNYDKFINNGARTDGIIICNKCKKEFLQPPTEHLAGHGCPYCRMSYGEIRVMNFLDDHKILHVQQKRYDDCRGLGNRKLPFDFYIPDYNLLIEFDGKQHYMAGCNIRSHITSIEEFKRTKEHDRRKTEYARINNIDLLRIPYYDMSRIPEILKEKLKL